MKTHLTRRGLLATSLATLVSPKPVLAANAPVLLELFTSQGCSSCPPADKIAGDLKNQDGIFIVSFNVDYWDYLGWRDTLAKPEYSKRQFDYGKSRGDMQVYTPQVVANGKLHAVGSNRSSVRDMIEQSRAKALPVDLSLAVSAKEISITIPQQDFEGEATLWLMAVEPQVKQKIERGENAGEHITYHNVVRNLVPAAMWRGEAFSGSWMHSAVMPDGCSSCIAVLQRDKTGPVLGLARII
jgi:hypothetical protein